MEVQTTAAAAAKKIFLTINCLLIATGSIGGPLIMRLYFLHGGKNLWFSGWLQTAGCPIILIPLLVSYTRRRITTTAAHLFLMNPRIFAAAAAIGVVIGLSNYTYSYGLSILPASTSSLLVATQLVFTAAFAFLVVKQRFTAYSINAVALLTTGAVVLGLDADGDRPEGESGGEYWSGFAITVAAAALYGLALPLVEVTYKKAEQGVTYTLVMEIQLVVCVFATVFCTVGMLCNNDFQGISSEAKDYELGERGYYLVVVCSALICQCMFLGVIGVVFYSSSLFSAMVITLCLPLTQLLALLFYNERFHLQKAISLFLSLLGFISYYWGDSKQN